MTHAMSIRSSWFAMLTALSAFSSACLAAQPVAGAALQGQTVPGRAAAPASPGSMRVCVDAQSSDALTQEFLVRLREAIGASGALSLGSAPESCGLQLHVPGNLLRFETAGGVMVSTVVIVTSPAGRYLSASITACRANELKPCAARAVAVAKLALLMNPNDGT